MSSVGHRIYDTNGEIEDQVFLNAAVSLIRKRGFDLQLVLHLDHQDIHPSKFENLVIETAELAFEVAQAAVELVGVFKKRVVRYTALHNLAISIESKAIRSYGIASLFQKNYEIPSFKRSNPELLICAPNSCHLIYSSRASRNLQVFY